MNGVDELTLGSLYTLHLLAQDFMKLSKPLFMASGKRDAGPSLSYNRTAALMDFETKINWNKVLQADPLKCALSLICQLAAGAESQNEQATIIYEFVAFSVENSKTVPKPLKESFENGLKYNDDLTKAKDNYRKCYRRYPLCPYSARTMLRIMSLFGSER
ncbi:AGAP011144-PA-like protein [Anopheles sinensis]|uniref:AGAP011144-PA-like protein n=1 Tax=Anopheles sinensis TaxID=74873 RepID=A0A084VG91_ANOSI|nr:AGAP011144-PA-like protein [Anopheles sinensis]